MKTMLTRMIPVVVATYAMRGTASQWSGTVPPGKQGVPQSWRSTFSKSLSDVAPEKRQSIANIWLAAWRPDDLKRAHTVGDEGGLPSYDSVALLSQAASTLQSYDTSKLAELRHYFATRDADKYFSSGLDAVVPASRAYFAALTDPPPAWLAKAPRWYAWKRGSGHKILTKAGDAASWDKTAAALRSYPQAEGERLLERLHKLTWGKPNYEFIPAKILQELGKHPEPVQDKLVATINAFGGFWRSLHYNYALKLLRTLSANTELPWEAIARDFSWSISFADGGTADHFMEHCLNDPTYTARLQNAQLRTQWFSAISLVSQKFRKEYSGGMYAGSYLICAADYLDSFPEAKWGEAAIAFQARYDYKMKDWFKGVPQADRLQRYRDSVCAAEQKRLAPWG